MDHFSISLAEATDAQLYEELTARYSSFIFAGIENKENGNDNDVSTWSNGKTTAMFGLRAILNKRMDQKLEEWCCDMDSHLENEQD